MAGALPFLWPRHEGLDQILRHQRCYVVGTVGDGRAMLAAVEQLRPDVTVLDIAMPLLNGLDAGWQLKKALPEVKLIFLAMMGTRSPTLSPLSRNMITRWRLFAFGEDVHSKPWISARETEGLVRAEEIADHAGVGGIGRMQMGVAPKRPIRVGAA